MRNNYERDAEECEDDDDDSPDDGDDNYTIARSVAELMWRSEERARVEGVIHCRGSLLAAGGLKSVNHTM